MVTWSNTPANYAGVTLRVPMDYFNAPKDHELMPTPSTSLKLDPETKERVRRLAAARRPVAAIRREISGLGRHPQIGHPVEDLDPEFWEWIADFGANAYVARYHYDGSQIALLAVRHGRDAGFEEPQKHRRLHTLSMTPAASNDEAWFASAAILPELMELRAGYRIRLSRRLVHAGLRVPITRRSGSRHAIGVRIGADYRLLIVGRTSFRSGRMRKRTTLPAT